MPLNLKKKSFLFVVASVAVLILAYVAVSHYYLKNIQEQTILDAHKERVEIAAKTLDEFFQRGIDKLDDVASLPSLAPQLDQEQQGHSIPASTTLHYMFWKSDVFTYGVTLMNTNGTILWLDPPDREQQGKVYPAFEQVRESFRNEPAANTSFVTWEPLDRKTQTQILLSMPVNDREGTLIGYLVGAIPTNHRTIQMALSDKSPVQTQLVADDATVVAGSDPARLMRQLPYREVVLSAVKTAKSSVFYSDTGATRSLIAFSNLSNAPWLVASDEDENSALSEVNNERLALILYGTLIAAVSMGTLIFVVRGFTRPVELLTAEAQRIAAGDMNVRFTVDRKDEIGVLASTLDDMKTRLNASYERLLQSEKMALMGQVVAGIAHELNNPLTIVIGHAELMLLKGVPEPHQAAIQRIHDGAERAAKIVKSLLTFARQKKPERKLTDINSIITKTVDLRQYEMKVSNVDLSLDLMPDLPLTMCDPHQLQQVFLNLMVNAEQAMIEANGKGKLTIRSQVKNRSIRVLFEDNGPGIGMENIRRLFDPFFTTKPVGQGTGLGLSICQGIMAEHNGNIAVESTPGFGATFTVELPIVTASPDSPPADFFAGIRPAAAAKKVLVIDDEGHMRELFGEILREEGHASISVTNGKEALQQLDQHHFDLVISDVKMPETDGPAFYQILKERKSALAEKVLFVTGDLMNPSTLRFLETCGNPWIAKPFDLKTVRDIVRRMLA